MKAPAIRQVDRILYTNTGLKTNLWIWIFDFRLAEKLQLTSFSIARLCEVCYNVQTIAQSKRYRLNLLD